MTRSRFRLLISSLFAVSFVGALDHTIVATSLPTIAGGFGALDHMGLILIGYTLANTVLIPVIGKVGDVAGHRTVFLAALATFVVASLACGFAQDMTQLVTARVLQGMGSAGLQLMSQVIVAHATTPRERPKYLSLIGSAFPVAILVGPLLGGVITDLWGWPWIFWINVPVGAAAFVLAVLAIPRIPRSAPERFDVPGAIAFTLGMVGLVVGVSWVRDAESPTAAVTALAVSAVAFVVFAFVSFRSPAPLVPLRLFANRSFAVAAALSAIVGTGLFAVTAYLPTYFQLGYSVTPTVSGVVSISTVFGMLIGNLTVGWLVSRIGRYRVFPIIGTLVGAGGMATMAALPVGTPLWVPAVVMMVVGLATGSFMSLPVAIAQMTAPSSMTGSVTATVNLSSLVGSTIGTTVLGAVIGAGVASRIPESAGLTPADLVTASSELRGEVAAAYVDVFWPIFLVLSAIYAAGFIAALLLPDGLLSHEEAPAAH